MLFQQSCGLSLLWCLRAKRNHSRWTDVGAIMWKWTCVDFWQPLHAGEFCSGIQVSLSATGFANFSERRFSFFIWKIVFVGVWKCGPCGPFTCSWSRWSPERPTTLPQGHWLGRSLVATFGASSLCGRWCGNESKGDVRLWIFLLLVKRVENTHTHTCRAYLILSVRHCGVSYFANIPVFIFICLTADT